MARPAGTLWSLEQRMETLQSRLQARLASSKPSSTHACRDEFVRAPDPDVRLDDRARACVGRRSKGGRSGRRSDARAAASPTKIHAKSDASGDIIAFDLTGGEASDARVTSTFCSTSDPTFRPRAVICDKGYASKANREAARSRGIAPVIPQVLAQQKCGTKVRYRTSRHGTSTTSATAT